MQRKEILKKISEAINEYEQGAQINEETTLVESRSNLSLSSLDFIAVILDIEDFYKISIPEDEIQSKELGKVSNLIDYILEKLAKKSS